MPQIRQPASAGKRGWWRTGCAVFVLCATTAIAAPPQTFKTLVSFDGTNGANPYLVTLVQGLNGSLYGTTEAGGNSSPYCLEAGCGTVFKLTATGTLTTLYNFCPQDECPDGELPYAGLAQATNGSLYGTASYGGYGACGTIFKITPEGTETTVASFPCPPAYPAAALVQGTGGNFYGTSPSNQGYFSAIFKITPAGVFTTLYTFCVDAPNCSTGDGAGGLVQATNGLLYGTTAINGRYGYGTIFQITRTGDLTTLHDFNGADGSGATGALVQATDGTYMGRRLEAGPTVTERSSKSRWVAH